jgi:hypothetical protein
LAAIERIPRDEPVAAVTVIVSPGSELTPPTAGPEKSLLVTPIVAVPVAVIVFVSFLATGGSLTSTSVIETVAGVEVSSPSLAVNVNASAPVRFTRGV